MEISIILVSYNTKNMTRDCLKSIYQFTQGVDFEVFVVDNNSHDGSADMIEQEFPQVRLIRNHDNKGFGAANNIAIRESKAKYVFLLNTDTLLLSNSIKEFYDFMEKEENQNTGACGGILIDKNGEPQTFGGKFPSAGGIFFKMFGLDKIFKNFYNKHYRIAIKDVSITPDFISGAALFLRKNVLDKVGVFDEKFFLYYEETDLCKRIKNAGFDISFLKYVKIVHLYSQSPIQSINQLKIYAHSQCYYYKKHVGIVIFIIMKIYNYFKILSAKSKIKGQ